METNHTLYKPGSVSASVKKANTQLVNSMRAKLFGPNKKKPEIRFGSIGQGIKELTTLKNNAVAIMAKSAADRFGSWADDTIKALQSQENLDAKKKLLEDARNGDGDAQRDLAEIVKVTTGQLLMASTTWLQFFDLVNLSHDDKVYVYNNVGSEIGVRTIGEDGKARVVTGTRNKAASLVDFFWLSSDIFEYQLVDLYEGTNAKDAALMTLDIARDMAAKLDELCQAQILVGTPGSIITASFTTTGPVANRSYAVHSRVKTANLPTGNLLTLTTNTNSSGPRLEMLKAAIGYVSAWGSGAFEDGDLRIEAVHVPSADAYRLLDEIGADNNGNSYAEEVMANVFRVTIGNFTFNIIADNTLDPAQPYAYFRTNKRAGVLYEKPELSDVIHEATAELRRENKERISERKALGFAMPVQWSVNVFAIQYRS